MILVNFVYINAASKDFLYDVLCFTLKQAQKIKNARDS